MVMVVTINYSHSSKFTLSWISSFNDSMSVIELEYIVRKVSINSPYKMMLVIKPFFNQIQQLLKQVESQKVTSQPAAQGSRSAGTISQDRTRSV